MDMDDEEEDELVTTWAKAFSMRWRRVKFIAEVP